MLRIVDGLFSSLVGAVLVYRSADAQRLGDRVANTVVVSASGSEEEEAAAPAADQHAS